MIALETLREVEGYFRSKTGVDVPAQKAAENFKGPDGKKRSREYLIDDEIYDLWRRVRQAIRELENGREAVPAGRRSGTAVTSSPALSVTTESKGTALRSNPIPHTS